MLSLTGSPARKLNVVIGHAHQKSRAAAKVLAADASAGPRLAVDAVLRALSFATSGDQRHAQRLVAVVPRLRHYVREGNWYEAGLFNLYWTNLEEAKGGRR